MKFKKILTGVSAFVVLFSVVTPTLAHAADYTVAPKTQEENLELRADYTNNIDVNQAQFNNFFVDNPTQSEAIRITYNYGLNGFTAPVAVEVRDFTTNGLIANSTLNPGQNVLAFVGANQPYIVYLRSTNGNGTVNFTVRTQ